MRNPLPSGPDPLACPVCRGPLSVRTASVRCTACALRYPRRDGVYLLGPPFALNAAGRTFATDRMRRLAADAHAVGWETARTISLGPPIGTNTTGQEAEGPHCINIAGGSHA